MRIGRAALALIVAFALARTAAGEVEVRVTVAEPAGLARTAEPASGGVPFKPGQVKSVDQLALVDASGRAVPAQFSKLAGYDDGSVQWALVDTFVTLPANGKAEFVVKTGTAAAPAKGLAIQEAEGAVTVNTGAATFVVNTADFNLLESVTVGGKKVAGPGSIDLTDTGGAVFKAAKPSRVSWEYKGPVRATLRVDGPYLGASGEYTAYTTRLTFWAGSSAVRVDHSIRNSHPTNGFDAKLKQATLLLALANAGAEQGKGANWAAVGGAEGGVLVADRHTAGAFPAQLHKLDVTGAKVQVFVVPPPPAGTRGMIGYAADHFAIADLAHKDSQVWFDFYTGGRDAAANEARFKALRSRILLLADGAWVSDTGALGPGRFGTLEDEIATYRKWGWKGVDDEKKRANARSLHQPDFAISKVDIHDESEADSVELFLLMWVRTGERGFYDRAQGYADYYKGHAVWRTDGFDYDGFRHERAGVVMKSKRKSTGLGHGWYGPREYGWSDSRFHMCHQWATGLIDYYCLTGDVDALEAGLDWAEYAALTHYDQKPGKNHGWGRAWGRSFSIVLRAWQVTREPKWKALADTYAQVAIKAPNRQADGLYVNGVGSMLDYFMRDHLELRPGRDAPILPRLKTYIQEKHLTWKPIRGDLMISDGSDTWPLLSSAQSFEYEACAGPVERYYELTGDQGARQLVVDMAKCARTYYWSTKCEHCIPHPYIGFPDKGKVFDRAVWDDEHANCPKDPGGKHSGYHTRFMTDIFARAHAASGDLEWLDWAKKAWNRGTKRGYWTTSQGVPDDEVAAFAGHSAPKGDAIDIRNSNRLFYEVAHAK